MGRLRGPKDTRGGGLFLPHARLTDETSRIDRDSEGDENSVSVRIRLRRMGTRKKPFYRIVVADQRCARDGRFIALLGNYDPRQDPPAINLDTEKAAQWLKNGAQPSEVVRSILAKHGLMEPARRPQGPVKPVVAEEAVTPAAEVAQAPAEVTDAPSEQTSEEVASPDQPATDEAENAASE